MYDMFEAKPKTGALVAYHAKHAVKKTGYISPVGRPKPPADIPWYYNRHNRVGKIGQSYLTGLTKAERALIRQGALVYLFAPSRGIKRLFIADCSRGIGRTDSKGRVLSYVWRYFARKPFLEEVLTLSALGVRIKPAAWDGFTKNRGLQ
jgi:hypothetical protein